MSQIYQLNLHFGAQISPYYMFIILVNINGSLAQIQGQSLSSIPQKALKMYANFTFL